MHRNRHLFVIRVFSPGCSLVRKTNMFENADLYRTTGICTSKKHGTSKHTKILIALKILKSYIKK